MSDARSRHQSAEEIHDASKVVPIAIGTSIVLNGCLGFAMLLALLFCQSDDIQATLDSETYYPFISIYAYAVQSNSGGTALVSYVRRMANAAEQGRY